MNVNISYNIFKQRMKYLIVWMMHYYSNRNKFKIKNDDDDDELDLDIKTNVMK